MKKGLLLLICLIGLGQVQAQNTVGLLSYDETQASPGYNIMFPHNQGTVWLLDNCGEVVHKWEDFTYAPGLSAKLDEQGNLYALKTRGQLSNDFIHAGGGGELLEVRDWDNNLLWSFVYNDSTNRLHHDMALMPNGNALMIAWEYKSEQEALDAGRDTALLADSVWPDVIIEVAPDGNGGGTIVWEWKAFDHLIQDYDATKANFGVIADHPELIDFNLGPDDDPDWMHSNAIDYNQFYDQILLSVPTLNEVWVIDHSTTTAQAASHSGGLSGRGGDLVYRWGNPANYGAGTAADQKLFYQHDAHWVDIGLTQSSPDFLKIAVFNNRVGEDFSTANIFAPTFDDYDTGYPMNAQGMWEPADFDWSYSAPVPQDLYSNIVSSLQVLPNGNRLICEGRPGYSFELNAANEKVWEYITPLQTGNPVAQGTVLPVSANITFRMKRYATDFDGFVGKDLTPIGWIETSPNEQFCDSLVFVRDFPLDAALEIVPNPASDFLNLSVEGLNGPTALGIYNSLGRLVYLDEKFDTTEKIDLRTWAPGVYFVQLEGARGQRFVIAR